MLLLLLLVINYGFYDSKLDEVGNWIRLSANIVHRHCVRNLEDCTLYTPTNPMVSFKFGPISDQYFWVYRL